MELRYDQGSLLNQHFESSEQSACYSQMSLGIVLKGQFPMETKLRFDCSLLVYLCFYAENFSSDTVKI